MSTTLHEATDQGDFLVTRKVQQDFDDNGYIVVRGLLLPEEITKLRNCVEQSEDIEKFAYGRSDGHGKVSRLTLWSYAGDDLCGVVTRSQKVAGTMQTLMGGDEIYHYHSKLIMKEAHTGGSFVWHQDYGYWYNNGCLLPEMGSIFIPIDRCVQANGCLQVLKGSHTMGRINHHLSGDQAGADLERVEQAKQMFPLVPVEMEPGDVLFFHCNLLHTSAQNHSDLRRYALITSINKRKNNPVTVHHHPQYHPLDILPNSAILQCDLFNSKINKKFVNPKDDVSTKTEHKP